MTFKELKVLQALLMRYINGKAEDFHWTDPKVSEIFGSLELDIYDIFSERVKNTKEDKNG